MKLLHFDYRMEITYSIPVDKCYYTIKCIPVNSDRQKLEKYDVYFEPDSQYSLGKDGFLNPYFYGSEEKPHGTFVFGIKGEVTVGMMEAESAKDDMKLAVFRHPYGLNTPGNQIKKYHDTFEFAEGQNAYDRVLTMMHQLYHDFVYQKQVTSMDTSAEEAFSMKKGVCQDYAHILISLCHLEAIPARYVAGMMLGEGASHAWVEVCIDGYWRGLDPTNDKVVDDDYIKLSHGRDATDCLINRGVIVGGGRQIQTVQVNVWE